MSRTLDVVTLTGAEYDALVERAAEAEKDAAQWKSAFDRTEAARLHLLADAARYRALADDFYNPNSEAVYSLVGQMPAPKDLDDAIDDAFALSPPKGDAK